MIGACLHTEQGNIAVFEAAAKELGISRSAAAHEVRADLLARTEEMGRRSPGAGIDGQGGESRDRGFSGL